jgi:hypothetical protein
MTFFARFASIALACLLFAPVAIVAMNQAAQMVA